MSSATLQPRYFSPGYGYRRRLVLPAAVHRLLPADGAVVVPFAETLLALRTVANGGKVQSSSGFDIRFETDDGTKLAHDLAAYAPTTGKIEAWVRIPGFASGVDYGFSLYYGKAGLSSSEANAAATWAGFAASWDMSTGLDASPSGAHLTLASVTPATIFAVNAGDFA